jgi:dTDP-glucose 4,6-dehydratase
LTILVTGGAGFIGANFVLQWLRSESEAIVNLDKLTYAGNLGSLTDAADHPKHDFVRGDICDSDLVSNLLDRHKPRAIVHLAAESHVDRSIHGPEDFIQTNITGTFRLLDAARNYWQSLGPGAREAFRFINVSTDEVYGSLGPDDPPFSENTPYCPNSPYSASKAAADHLARAYHHTYGLPVIVTHCTNNYGPYQFPEKLIPLVILNALGGDPLPVYGDGGNVRDWLHVHDHYEALRLVLARGKIGETYDIGGNCEKNNLEVVESVCSLLDEIRPTKSGRRYCDQITFVTDRPGHDRRYAIDTTKVRAETGWQPRESFDSGLRKTVNWYLDNQAWITEVNTGEYRKWIDVNYGLRKAAE